MHNLIDLLLALALPGVALGVLLARDLYQAVVVFIAFGLLMALVWIRLQAPDLALAEAAIGAGLSGILLLDALGHLEGTRHPVSTRIAPLLPIIKGMAWLLVVAFGLVLLGALTQDTSPTVHLPQQVADNLASSGVDHPVTAVLLSFRAYDTLLEVAVILVAVVVGLALRFSLDDAPRETQVSSPLLHGMLTWLLPLMLLVAAYLLWIGSTRSGGAFQAAAVLAALLVLMRLSGLRPPGQDSLLMLRAGLVCGPLLFLLLGSFNLMSGGAFLAWPEGWGGVFILVIEAGLTFSLALLLFSLFEASPAPHQKALLRKTSNE